MKKKKKGIRIRINITKAELLMLEQLLGKCCPDKDLSNFNGEREAVHTFAVKVFKRNRVISNAKMDLNNKICFQNNCSLNMNGKCQARKKYLWCKRRIFELKIKYKFEK